MYIPDLSKQLYTADLHEGKQALSVGWLGNKVELQGIVPQKLASVLQHRAEFHFIHVWRGRHTCEICNKVSDGGEFWFDIDNLRYVLPKMVLHYINDHNYCPPNQFLESLSSYMNSPHWDNCRNLVCEPLRCRIAARGDVDHLRSLHNKGLYLFAEDEQGHTPLEFAIYARQMEVIKFLIEISGFDKRILDQALRTAIGLINDSDYGSVLWIDFDGVLKSQRSEGYSFEREMLLVNLLIEMGADVNFRCSEWNVPVVFSATKGDYIPLIELLIDRGARLDVQDDKGRTLRDWAKYRGREMKEFLERLIDTRNNV
ncbi:MAG: hypothetical protein GY832_20195 [Chloroflexi bacterium]|nr:hypothetical protein [Chloroflexota bacterium]